MALTRGKHVKRVWAFNLFSTCIRGTITHIPRVFHVAVPAGTWVKKLIERTVNRLFLGTEYRGLQFINSVKN